MDGTCAHTKIRPWRLVFIYPIFAIFLILLLFFLFSLFSTFSSGVVIRSRPIESRVHVDGWKIKVKEKEQKQSILRVWKRVSKRVFNSEVCIRVKLPIRQPIFHTSTMTEINKKWKKKIHECKRGLRTYKLKTIQRTRVGWKRLKCECEYKWPSRLIHRARKCIQMVSQLPQC